MKTKAVLIAVAALVVCIAWSSKPQSKLTLISPNGKFSIVLDARDDGAGIYVWQGGKRGVSVYTNASQGPAVTVYGNMEKQTNPGIALGDDFIQFIDGKKVHHATVVDGKWKIASH